jgi:hypothetical protein
MEKPMKIQKIPETDSIEELARFWDTHDLTDFEDQLEEVTEPVFERLNEIVVELHLKRQEFDVIEQLAESQGVESAELVRGWVLEKIH